MSAAAPASAAPAPAAVPAPAAPGAAVLGSGSRRWGIAGKLGLLVGSLVLALGGSTAALLVQARQTTQEYDRILSGQVADGLLARQDQVEFKRQVQEWKDILLRGFNPTDLKTYTANFELRGGNVNRITDQLIARTSDPWVRSQITLFRTQHTQLDADYQQSYDLFVAGQGKNPVASDRMVRGKDRPPTDLLDRVADHLNQAIATRVAAQKSTVADRQRIGLILGVLLIGLLAVLVALAIRRLVTPIRGLTRAARQVADESLPAAISQIRSMPPDAQAPALPAYRVQTRDELADLSEAFAQVQSRAVELAVQQHRAEREAAEMLVNLGRRNQNLLSRLLTQVSELERTEQDPETLGRLFQLDHAATRIRRNAESMLVLAGAAQTRTFAVPVPFEDVIRAALSEVEDYVRVDLYHIEDGMISGSAAADIVHLLAELIENATHFSPPHTQVTVVGQRVREGYRIRVTDQGVGMTHRELTEANERIVTAAAGRSDSKLLGLYVVGRLAARRGIEVVLEPSATRGITATVLIPPNTLAGSAAGTGASAGSARPEPSRWATPASAPALPSGAPMLRPVNGNTTSGPIPIVPTRPEIPPRPAAAPAPAPAPGPARPNPGPGASGPWGSGAGTHPPMPKRVPGAQLAAVDLGDSDGQPAFAPPTESSRWNLRSFQLDVEAARRLIEQQGGGATPARPYPPAPSPQGRAPDYRREDG